MYTKRALKTHLANLGIKPDGTLIVHVSYRAIGSVRGRGDAVLDALTEYMEPGLLVLPAHTWDNVKKENPVMDVLYTPSCVGILTEMFRKREGVRRSLHPTHSLAALGKDAEVFLSGEELMTSPCSRGGVYYKLWQRNAQILLIGVNLARNTFIHGSEEWDGAKGSLTSKKTDFYVINYDGRRLYTPIRTMCSPLFSETFVKLEPLALQTGVMSMGRFGDATARLMQAAPLRKLTAKQLKADPTYFHRH